MKNSRQTNKNRVLKNSVHASSQEIGIKKTERKKKKCISRKIQIGKMSIARAHMPRRSLHTALGLRQGLEREPRVQTPTNKKKVDVQKIHISFRYILISINSYHTKTYCIDVPDDWKHGSGSVQLVLRVISVVAMLIIFLHPTLH